jgi:hypothetical protein
VVAASVHEERRRAGDAAAIGTVDVSRHPAGSDVAAKVVAKSVDVETELAGVAHEISRHELVLMLEEQVVHRPERTLQSGGFGCFGGGLRVWMDIG